MTNDQFLMTKRRKSGRAYRCGLSARPQPSLVIRHWDLVIQALLAALRHDQDGLGMQMRPMGEDEALQDDGLLLAQRFESDLSFGTVLGGGRGSHRDNMAPDLQRLTSQEDRQTQSLADRQRVRHIEPQSLQPQPRRACVEIGTGAFDTYRQIHADRFVKDRACG